MALRMQPPATASSQANTPMSGGRPSVIQSDGAPKGTGGEDRQSQDYFSPPVFPGQMSVAQNHATPYHAAAQSYQQGNQANYPDAGNHQQQFGSPQKGLPEFADFRRQFGLYPETPSTSGGSYPDSYQGPMTSTPHFSSAGHMTGPAAFPTSYSSQGMAPHSAPYAPDGKQMPVGYDSGPPVPPYPGMKMPVFPGMQCQAGHDDAAAGGQPLPQPGDLQQFEPMLQFQPLSS
nr:hypothetical protein BaRGS_027932 [Batillaria attramentaria]